MKYSRQQSLCDVHGTGCREMAIVPADKLIRSVCNLGQTAAPIAHGIANREIRDRLANQSLPERRIEPEIRRIEPGVNPVWHSMERDIPDGSFVDELGQRLFPSWCGPDDNTHREAGVHQRGNRRRQLSADTRLCFPIRRVLPPGREENDDGRPRLLNFPEDEQIPLRAPLTAESDQRRTAVSRELREPVPLPTNLVHARVEPRRM